MISRIAIANGWPVSCGTCWCRSPGRSEHTVDEHHYVIRGGIEGRERLRVLSRVMRPGTLSLLDRAGVGPGMRVLDVGCGGGDVTFDLASLVGPTGRVVGVDIDPVKIGLARDDAERNRVGNVEFRVGDVSQGPVDPAGFDVVYVRFVLWVLPDPEAALGEMLAALRPGGRFVVEDIDYHGSYCHPMTDAWRRYEEIFTQTALATGGDPYLGIRLPGLLLEAGLQGVQPSIVQPAGLEGEVKALHALTLENIKAAVDQHAVATPEEVDDLVDALYEIARDPSTYVLAPRIVQAYGDRPSL
jgi:SAM-dependent methyltransferase